MRRMLCLLTLALAPLVPLARAEEATKDEALVVDDSDFLVRDTQDLVELCSVAPASRHREAAIHFCEGFAVGVYGFHEAVTGPNRPPLVCLPDPPPSRAEGIRQFVAWAQQHPEVLTERPANGLMRFMVATWPCPAKEAKKP